MSWFQNMFVEAEIPASKFFRDEDVEGYVLAEGFVEGTDELYFESVVHYPKVGTSIDLTDELTWDQEDIVGLKLWENYWDRVGG